jgi:hypothetical protein
MVDIKIKTETLPARCEVCHQSDWFDPSSNRCARCDNSKIIHTKKEERLIESENRFKLFSDFLKPIFLKWEKLRILYNFILGLVLIVSHIPYMGRDFFHPSMLLLWLIGMVLANICFLTGPIIESYISWLGLKSSWITALLFIGGLLISIPCVLFFGPPF